MLKNRFPSIPQEWKIGPLGTFLYERKEYTADLDQYSLHSFTIEDGVTPKTERYNRDFLLRDKENNQFRIVYPGDLVYNPMNLRFGAISICRTKDPVTISAYYHVLRLKESSCCPIFLEALLRSPQILSLFDAIAIGSLIEKRRVHLSLFRATPIPIPSLLEQKKIADILSTWDEAIEQTRRLIGLKKRRKKALMQQLLTGKKRLPEFVKSSRCIPYRFFDLPEDWQCPQIGKMAHECIERNGNGEKMTVLSCSKHVGFVESAQYFGKQVFSEDTSNYKVIRRSWFGYPSNHIEEGSIGLLTTHDMGIVSPIYTIFQTNAKIYPEFLYALFKTDTYRHIFKMSTNASVDRRGSLRWREFSRIQVPLPSLKEQHRIADVLSAADDGIKILEQKLSALEKQKRGLMQKLLTGEIRVNG
ncbi:MAG: restriction endonuclease subunit S [Deltaproteobacteria bacterium]|nr:restriction endonuclease subunit S [Deltaproteobacteria bacterium]